MTDEGGPAVDGQRRHDLSRIVSWVLLVLGVAIAVFFGWSWRHTLEHQADERVDRTAANVTQAVDTGLLRNLDLVVAARTFVSLAGGQLATTELQAWFEGMDAEQRYDSLDGIGFVERVRAEDLASFAAETYGAQVDPAADVAAELGIQPPGARASYCLGAAGVEATESFAVAPEVVDMCGGPLPFASGARLDLRDAFAAAETTGDTTTVPLDQQGRPKVVVVQPVFVDPTTPLGSPGEPVRGWLIAGFDIGTLLEGVVAANPGVSAELERTEPGGTTYTAARAVADPAPTADAQVREARFGRTGTWDLTMNVTPDPTPAQIDGQSLLRVVAVLLVTGLVVAVVRVFGSSKQRAWRLVRERTADLAHLALHDPLTSLPNRSLLLDRAEHMLERARRSGHAPAAMYIDLDGFKAVNDTFGHAVGDELLVAVAGRFRAVLRQSDTIGRIGGDEFVVLVEGEPDGPSAEVVAQRVIDALDEPFELESLPGQKIRIGTSIGVALGARPTADEMLRDADVALYEAKERGRGRVVVFRTEMHEVLRARMQLEQELAQSLEDGDFVLEYQPSVDLETLEVTGVEAFVRWQHPTRGRLLPAAFLPVAEETGLIGPLGRWVLGEACRQQSEWEAEGRDLRVAVNVSPRQFADEGFLDDVRQALGGAGVAPDRLALEIGEAILLHDSRDMVARLEELRAIGVRLVVDDFATGYASLVGLRHFPVDVLKLDRRFVNALGRSPSASSVIRALVQLGRALGLTTVAEGVERREELEALRAEGCDGAQGHLFARPVAGDDVAALLDSMARSGLVPRKPG